MSHGISSDQVWLAFSCVLYAVFKFCCSCRLTGQDTTIRSQPSTSQPDSLPQPPAHSDFPHPQAPRPSLPVGQPPMGPVPPPGVPPHFPGPPNQPPAPVGPGSQGEHRPPACMDSAPQAGSAVDALLYIRRLHVHGTQSHVLTCHQTTATSILEKNNLVVAHCKAWPRGETTGRQFLGDDVHSFDCRGSCTSNAPCSQYANGHARAWPLWDAPLPPSRCAYGAPSRQTARGGPRCPSQQANSPGPSKN